MSRTTTSCSTTSVADTSHIMLITRNKASAALVASLFLFALMLMAGCDRRATLATVSAAGDTMGTYYNVKLAGEEGQLPTQDQVTAWADQVFGEINASMSTYLEDSELSKLNRSDSEDWQSVSAPLFEVLAISQDVSRMSGGAFDITVAPLVNLWGFGPQKRQKEAPSDEQIAALLTSIGYQKLELDAQRQALRKPSGLALDLSAVAKGYAADQLANFLEAKGYDNIMVEVGGELALRGVNARERPWKIGIESPSYSVLAPAKGPAQTVALSGRGMATSGDYRNYYEIDGERFSHTIDPVTGRPITHTLASVTIIAESSAKADALATALNVLGPEKAMALAEKEGIAAFLIVRSGDGFEPRVSSAFRPYLSE